MHPDVLDPGEREPAAARPTDLTTPPDGAPHPAGERAPAQGARQARQAPPATVGVLSYNILVGGGPRLAAIEQVIRDSGADVVGVEEATRPDLLPGLAERLGMTYALARSPTNFHVAVLSRWPIVEAHDLGGGRLSKALLDASIALPDGGRLRLFVTHLSASFSEPRTGEPRRLRELAHVLERMGAARAAGEPHLLVGDFNSLAPGERLRATMVLRHTLAVDAAQRRTGTALPGQPGTNYILPPRARPFLPPLRAASAVPPLAWLCDALIGLYVPRAVVRRLRAAGYVDCYAATHPDPRRRAFTCPAQAPAGRIDYAFADPALASRLVTCEVLTDTPACPVTRASDHRPVLARFQLAPSPDR